MLLGSVRKVRGAEDARKHFPGFPSLHIPQRGEGVGPMALRARSSETLTLSNPEVAGTGVRLRLRAETSAFIKTFFAFVKENNTLRFQKLYERGALSLPSALVLLSLVWKENTALQTNTREKGTGQLKKKGAGVKCSPKPMGQPQASTARTLPGLCSLSAAPHGHRPGPSWVRARWHQAPRAVTRVSPHTQGRSTARTSQTCAEHTQLPRHGRGTVRRTQAKAAS